MLNIIFYLALCPTEMGLVPGGTLRTFWEPPYTISTSQNTKQNMHGTPVKGASRRGTENDSRARILKTPVQNSNSNISANPDLATQLLQMLLRTRFNRLSCQRRQFTLHSCPRRWFVWKWFSYHPQKGKIENLKTS